MSHHITLPKINFYSEATQIKNLPKHASSPNALKTTDLPL